MNAKRRSIDPYGKYDLGDLRRFETFALRVLDLLSGARVERARDVIQIQHGDDRGVVVLVTPEALELRLRTLEWPHPHTPGPSSRLRKRLKWDRLNNKRLVRLLDEARKV